MLVTSLCSYGFAAKATVADDPPIQDINHIVKNFSIKVELPSGLPKDEDWTIGNKTITYTLQGCSDDCTNEKSWKNVFGLGAQANTKITLDYAPKALHVVVPMFDSQSFTQFRLLFMTLKYQPVGYIPLSFKQNGKTYSNNGSIAENVYALHWGVVRADLTSEKDENPSSALAKPAHPPKIQINPATGQKQIYVWGKDKQGDSEKYIPFFIRGMDYEPTPVGQVYTGKGDPVTADNEPVYLASFNKQGGGQICSPLQGGPYGQSNQSYCFDTDMTGEMHQYLNNTALDGAVERNALLEKMWNRDLSVMQAMGINTIRIYHIDPLVRNMTDFLNLAHKYGIYVIMPAPSEADQQTFSKSPLSGKLLSWEAMTDKVKGKNGQPWGALMQLSLAKYAANPAILAWAVGNETEADNGKQDAAKVERYLARVIKAFDPAILVTSTNQDHYNTKENWQNYWDVFKNTSTTPESSYIDFYSVNTYRGISANKLDFGDFKNFLQVYNSINDNIKLPLFISEWGKYSTYDWGDFANKWGYDLLWRIILQSANKMSLLGGAYFEFSDEPVAKNLADQHYMGVVAYKLGQNYDTNPMVSDALVLKTDAYSGIKLGNDAGAQNYPALGRGSFDSFIGDNKEVAHIILPDGTLVTQSIQDSTISKVPNIAYCAYSQSSSPNDIDPGCLRLDASINQVPKYNISISVAAGEKIQSVNLNGAQLTADSSGSYSATTTGVLQVILQSGAKLQVGYSDLSNIDPSEEDNTLLSSGFKGEPNINFQNNTLNLALPV